MALATVNKLRCPIGRVGGEAASFSEDGGGAPPARRLWWIPAIRGAIAVTLGVLVIATGSRRRRWSISSGRTGCSAPFSPSPGPCGPGGGAAPGWAFGWDGWPGGRAAGLPRPGTGRFSARFLLDALGVSAVLTGTLRLLGAFEVERRTGRWWTFGGLALGSVEIVPGAIVLVAGSGNLRLVTVAIAAWG